MSLPRLCTSIVALLLAFLCCALLPAQEAGGVSSGIPGGATPSAAGAKDPNALPWKFLASPLGLLDPGAWNPQTIKGFSDPTKWDCKQNPRCTPHLVEKLVADTVGADPANGGVDPKKKPYLALHVVDYGSGANLSDWWYLYHFADNKWSYAKFTGQRIYGSPSVLFLFVHLNVQGVNSKPKGDSTPAKGQAELMQALESRDAKQLAVFCPAGSTSHFQRLRSGVISPDYGNVHYESAVVKRTPANVANLLSVLKLLGIAAEAARACTEVQTEPVMLWGAGRLDNVGLPSDIKVAGYSVAPETPMTDQDRSTKQLGATGAFNDEQLYWWDASIGIPVHKIKDLQYSVSNNTVVATQVDKQSAYALFNLMVRPVDLSDPKSNVWPRFLVGFPLSSSPWDRLFAGAGLGVPLKPLRNFQFFAGATFNRIRQPATLLAGDPATDSQLQSDLKIKFTPKFTFGVNVPVLSVFEKLIRQ